MRVPDPKANTTIEAYLAYKAGYLEESELKPKLYKPDWHFDGWLAYWAGLTNEYPTKENGDPEMLTDEEALVAYLSGVTDTYPEEIKDPYDVRIVGYLKHLASVRWPEPDYPVNNEEFYLSTMEPTHTSNPEPSSDIELDTAEGKIINVEAYGNTTQQTYSGKNLIDNTDVTYDFTNVSSSDNHLSALPTGIRYRTTYSSSGAPIVTFKLPIDLTQYIGKVVRMKATFGDKGGIRIAKVDETLSTRHIVADGNTSGETISWTVPNDLGDVKWLAYSLAILEPGGEVTVDFTDLIMTIDNSDMTYEPYVGGIPAPNPDYPQEIKVVTGEQTVSVHGKNLAYTGWAENFVTRVNNSILATIETFDNRNCLKFYASASHGDYDNKYIFKTDFAENTQYTFSFDLYIENANGFTNLAVDYTDGTTTEIPRITQNTWTSVAFTTTSGKTVKYLRANWRGDNSYIDINTFMVEKSPTPTTYEPYQSSTYTVNLGSTELCKIGDYQDYIYKSGDDWYVHKEFGKYTFTGSETFNYQSVYGGFTITSSNLISYMPGIQTPLNGYSNYFTIETSTTTWTGEGKIGLSASGTFWAKSTAFGSTQQSCETWLSTNTPTVYYILATPTDTKITDATLISELEALAGADTYNEKTFIKVTATDPNLPALLKVEAYKY